MRFVFPLLIGIVGAGFIACGSDSSDPKSTGGGGSSGAGGSGDSGAAVNEVRIIRDERGVPHVFSQTLSQAFYGLGYASAQDRLWQMHHARLTMRGRLAEVYSVPVPVSEPEASEATGFNRGLLDADRLARTIGYARHAEQTWKQLPGDVPELLQSFADGVNAWLRSPSFQLPPAFASAALDSVEDWTPADSLLAWSFVASLAGAPDVYSEIDAFNDCQDANGCTIPACNPPLDEAAATVPPPADGIWPPASSRSAPGASGGSSANPARSEIPVKFSHTFAVAGSRTTTGRPVLFGEPQLGVTAPSPWYEFHLNAEADAVDVRGMGFPGAPGVVAFFNRHIGQVVSAGGGDTSDLFELKAGTTPSSYVVDGQEKVLDVISETIQVRHAEPVSLTIEQSDFGPVVSGLVPIAPAKKRFALRYVEHFSTDQHSIVAGIELMRAHDLASYQAAIGSWSQPTVNAIYAGVERDDPSTSHIAYHSLLRIPVRKKLVVQGQDLTGRHPYDGSQSANDWQGLHGLEWNPHVVDPDDGQLVNGNSLPAGGWYGDVVYAGLGGNGETYRSLAVRAALGKLLPDAAAKTTPQALHLLHHDATSEFTRLFLKLYRAMFQAGLIAPPVDPNATAQTPSEKAGRVLLALEAWESAGAELSYENAWAPLADIMHGEAIDQSRDDNNPAIECNFNAGEGGVSFLLKSFDADPSVLNADVADFAIDTAVATWDEFMKTTPAPSQDPSQWLAATPPFVVAYQTNLGCYMPGDAGCSLDGKNELAVILEHGFVHTIGAGRGQSFPLTVDFSDLDKSRALLPPGVSEDPKSPFFSQAVAAWEASARGEDSIPEAPLTRSLIEAKSTSETILIREP